MVDYLNTQNESISKFSAWEILRKRFRASPEAWWKFRSLREYLASVISGLLEVMLGHLHLVSQFCPSWYLVLEGNGSQEKGGGWSTSPLPTHACPLPKQFLNPAVRQTSSMQEEKIDPANRFRFPVGCQMLSLVGHKDLKEQDPSGLLLSYS